MKAALALITTRPHRVLAGSASLWARGPSLELSPYCRACPRLATFAGTPMGADWCVSPRRTALALRVHPLGRSLPYWIVFAAMAVLLANLFVARAGARPQSAQYVTTVWQTEQGLPQNSVTAMVQDHEGYLWIGTFGGLARFDGERFTVFSSADNPGFGSDRILSLHETRSGALWIGTVERRTADTPRSSPLPSRRIGSSPR
jgi:hypothetical protein